uniref:Uncharacterized protein n=1 Tax=Oryza punctata TaxID=4537 RepID=A0A0E0LPR9_ORYPU
MSALDFTSGINENSVVGCCQWRQYYYTVLYDISRTDIMRLDDGKYRNPHNMVNPKFVPARQYADQIGSSGRSDHYNIAAQIGYSGRSD